MAQYRIVRKAGTIDSPDSPHMIQQKVLGLFWSTRTGKCDEWDLSDCEILLESVLGVLGLFWATRIGRRGDWNLSDCEVLLEERAQKAELKKKYPRDVVVKEYHG